MYRELRVKGSKMLKVEGNCCIYNDRCGGFKGVVKVYKYDVVGSVCLCMRL